MLQGKFIDMYIMVTLSFNNGFLISIYGETAITAFNVFFKVAIYKLENILHLK